MMRIKRTFESHNLGGTRPKKGFEAGPKRGRAGPTLVDPKRFVCDKAGRQSGQKEPEIGRCWPTEWPKPARNCSKEGQNWQLGRNQTKSIRNHSSIWRNWQEPAKCWPKPTDRWTEQQSENGRGGPQIWSKSCLNQPTLRDGHNRLVARRSGCRGARRGASRDISSRWPHRRRPSLERFARPSLCPHISPFWGASGGLLTNRDVGVPGGAGCGQVLATRPEE